LYFYVQKDTCKWEDSSSASYEWRRSFGSYPDHVYLVSNFPFTQISFVNEIHFF